MSLGLFPTSGAPVAAAGARPLAIIPEVGSYIVSGQNITLRKSSMLPAAAGSYTVTGVAIEFAISFSPASFRRVILIGSTSVRAYGFQMIQNFFMTAGDTKTLVISVKDANGNPVSISGAGIKWQAARSMGKASVISKATGGSGISISDAANGEFTVTLNASDTESLKGIYHHEAQLTLSDSSIATVLQGTMKINRSLIEAT